MAKLVLIERDYRKNYKLKENLTTIGRDPECEIPLKDSLAIISRKHAFILKHQKDYYLGSISEKETNLRIRKNFFWSYPPIKLNNLMKTNFFNKYLSKLQDKVYDEKEYFLNNFLADEEETENLIRARLLFNLRTGDVIQIKNKILIFRRTLADLI